MCTQSGKYDHINDHRFSYNLYQNSLVSDVPVFIPSNQYQSDVAVHDPDVDHDKLTQVFIIIFY